MISRSAQETREIGMRLAAHLKRGDVVLLSPASASFDLYRNFMERGRHFKDLVNAL